VFILGVLKHISEYNLVLRYDVKLPEFIADGLKTGGMIVDKNALNKFPLRMNLQLFAEGKDNDATSEGNVTSDVGSDENNKTNGDSKKQESKLFTQEELDEIITKRLERERKKYADYEELKAKLAEYEKQEEERKRAEMSEIQRLQADLQAKIRS